LSGPSSTFCGEALQKGKERKVWQDLWGGSEQEGKIWQDILHVCFVSALASFKLYKSLG
jgi:hypothetical protein